MYIIGSWGGLKRGRWSVPLDVSDRMDPFRSFVQEAVIADRALRGMQIGAKSLESEDGVVFADRFVVRYACLNGHEFEVTLSSEATAPATWECKCGQAAELIGETVEDEENKPVKPQRTHWDMLLERRSIEELEVVLTEQLTAYREGRLRPEGSYRKG